MRGKIYTVGIRLTYDIYDSGYLWKKPTLIKKDVQTRWKKPIFANHGTEAILKYESIRNIEKCFVDIFDADHDLFQQVEYRNIERLTYVVSDTNKYTFDELKAHMNSQDFLEYCRQELIGVGEIVK